MASETDLAIAKLYEAVARLEVKVDNLNRLIQGQSAADDTLRSVIYGDADKHGLLGRIRITETRLHIFWWVLSVTGAATITALVQVFSKV